MAPSAILPEEVDAEVEYVIVHGGKGTLKRPILKGKAMKPTFEEIPQVDFANLDSGNIEDRQAIATNVRQAFSNVGFMYAVNHGISEELQADCHINNSDTIKGYEALLETKLDQKTRGDLKEAFSVGPSPYDPEQKPPPGLDLSKYPKKANQWPEQPKDFRKVMYEYRSALLEFGIKLMRVIALALGQEETYFDNLTGVDFAETRALHYPSQDVPEDVGIGAHADYSWFTLVNQLSATPALEVLNQNGHWVSAPPIPNTLVVNVGDFLERASNDYFVSTVHRVVNKTGEERYSIPFFFMGSPDFMIQTVPSCITPERPARYEPINTAEWIRERLLRARYKHPAGIAAREKESMGEL
ncbi:hypothetical protein BP6252_10838 [Coleophoma cylindrospora]|uniref:Fe2OG dioxygenase domain-containing protein n=1 Tax=Coleophoma cylindrospora TaxID=1849047 RepID=A0A3D8QN93_9HELO|nr:hypothetical protein BP6252_10838 [Coleophoma cylindrospora]